MLKDKIALIYKKEGIVPEPMDVFVWDARNDNVSGPYTHASATKMAKDLSIHALYGEFPVLASLVKKVCGPFYVVNKEGKQMGGYEP